MHVEIAFGVDPYVMPAESDYVDVTSDFIGATINHGRQSVLDQYQPANATVELWNLNRQYEPDYAAGPHYPDIVGDTWLRLGGDYGQSITLDGVDDYLSVGDFHDFAGTVPFTVEAWVNHRELVDDMILDKSSSTDGWCFFLNGTGGVTFQRRAASVTQAASGGVVPLNTWTHVAGAYDGTTLRVYVNGVLVASTASSLSLPNTALLLNIGRRNVTTNFFFAGEISDVRVWNVARTEAEIQAKMWATLTGTETGLVDYWPMSEGAGGTAVSLVVDGHTATLQNGAAWLPRHDDLFTGLINIDGWQPEWSLPQKITVQATGYTAALGHKALVDPWKQATLDASPYACYPMMDTGGVAFDISGNNHHGTYEGPVVLGQHDPVDDGVDSGKLCNAENNGWLEADFGWSGTGDFTVTVWLNVNGGNTSDLEPIKFGLIPFVGKEAELIANPSGGTFTLSFYIDNTFALEPADLFQAGYWYWVVIERSGTTVRMIVNEFVVASGVSSSVIGTGPFRAGLAGVLDVAGYLIAWPTFYDYKVSDADRAVMWAARDGWEGDTAGPRLEKIFEQIGIDPAMGDFDTGTSLLPPATIDGASALTHARAVELAELGGLYELPNGPIRLRERHALYFAPYLTSQVTIGRGAGELPYEQISPEQSVVYNEAVGSREDGQTFVAKDTSTRFLNRAISETGLHLQSDNEVADRVSWRVATNKDQRFFPASVTLNPHADDGLWPHVLRRFLEDRVTIKRTDAVGSVVSRECYIQGITHQILPGQKWRTTWRLSPVVGGPSPWLVGVAGRSEVGATTFVGY